jgi:predicted transcriptional regulator
MRYRSKDEIMAAVLQAANKGATKTRIMYGAFLSHGQVQEYIEFLVERGLLYRQDGSHVYELTKKGLQFLHAHDELQSLTALQLPDKDSEKPKLANANVEA